MYTRISTRMLAALLLLAPTASSQCEQAQLVAADGTKWDLFGEQVAISGNTAIVSARDANSPSPGVVSGAAYVFEQIATGWSQVAKLVASDYGHLDYFGASVAIDGDMALVGAPGGDEGAVDTGCVYVFERVAGVWTETTKLVHDKPQSQDCLGSLVALSGNRALIGRNGGGQGAAYVFERGPTGWSDVAEFQPAGLTPKTAFGLVGAIDGDVAVLGDPKGESSGKTIGFVYVYERTPFGWLEKATLRHALEPYSSFFGKRVAIDGNNIVASAELIVGGYTEVALFQPVLGLLTQTASCATGKLSPPDGFGSSLAIEGNHVLVGAVADQEVAPHAGAVHLFDLSGSSLTWQRKIVAFDGAENDDFGISIAASGDLLAVGVETCCLNPAADDAAYVFKLSGLADGYGQGCPGAGGFTPRIKLFGCPVAGAEVVFGVERGLGGSLALLFFGDSQASWPLDGGCLLNVLPLKPAFLTVRLSGIPLPGEGKLVLPYKFPASAPSVTFTMQAFVFDGSVPQGYSNSNGLEVLVQ